jgi:hypothetical protein
MLFVVMLLLLSSFYSAVNLVSDVVVFVTHVVSTYIVVVLVALVAVNVVFDVVVVFVIK